MLPQQIVENEAAASERNRLARLDREAEEESSGIQQPKSIQSYGIVESFKKFEVKDDGTESQRACFGKAI
jgi:hypothetical protein